VNPKGSHRARQRHNF
jgi:hypothetical protein